MSGEAVTPRVDGRSRLHSCALHECLLVLCTEVHWHTLEPKVMLTSRVCDL